MRLRPSDRRAAGRAVEAEVARWLEAAGCVVVDRGFTARGGELDLVVRHGEVLAFVEVRSRRDRRHGLPEETVRPEKMRRVVQAARAWLQRHGTPELDLRFDVVAVEGEGAERRFRWYRGAFEAGL